ncbi:MAG: hypothetical protein O2930_00615 [Acidobacteria bacterium]|nr:hypothetical protein [Acidobacteriota bacterium]
MARRSEIDHDRRWRLSYAASLAVGFSTLYLLTRSTFLTGGTEAWINSARNGNPSDMHYAEPAHFLQVVLSRLIWVTTDKIGLPVSLESVAFSLSLAGTIAAIIFFGLIAEQVLRTRAAAWLAALLFGTSHLVWIQSNGELSGLAHGFVTAALFLALRGWVFLPALLWAMAVLAHAAFALVTPAFVLAVWMVRPADATIANTARRASTLLLVGGSVTIAVLLWGSFEIGKWHDSASLAQYLMDTSESRDADSFEVVRAAKGLLTAFTVGGHYWRDILTGRGSFSNPFFIPASGLALFVIGILGVCIVASLRRFGVAMLGVAWFLPPHVLLNWQFAPTVEKHHAAALPGLVLLFTAGLIVLTERMSPRVRFRTCAGVVLACAGLSFFGSILPLQAVGRESDAAQRAILTLNDERSGNVAFVSCDDTKAVAQPGISYLRLKSIWREPQREMQAAILSWTRARIDEGVDVYVLLRWCRPDQWSTAWSEEPFDLLFLEREFALVPTLIANVPVLQGPATDPFAWTTGSVARVVPKARSMPGAP